MKVAAAAHDVRTSGIGESHAFTLDMRDPSKLFDVLINYTNPIGAVVREYACNALDIHQQVGQTRPFLVIAPSEAEPMFRVRDFGTGMTEEQVKTLYCSFLRSTKDDSNDLVGGFGLGSKSGFAYADMFTVTSWQNGVKSVYTVFRGPDRVPRISLAETGESDEPTGFEIAIPVKPTDFGRFRFEMQDKLQYFPAGSFETVGRDVETYNPTMSGDGWSTSVSLSQGGATTYYYGHRKPKVKMGPVVYACDWSLVGDIIEIDDLIIEVPMGSVGLPFTREHVSLDDGTIALLRRRLREVRDDALALIKKTLAEAPSAWEAATYAYQIGSIAAVWDKEFKQTTHGQFSFGVVGDHIAKTERGTYQIDVPGMLADYNDTDRIAPRWKSELKPKVRPGTTVVVLDDLSATTRFPHLWSRIRVHRGRIGRMFPRAPQGASLSVLVVEDKPGVLDALGNPPDIVVVRASELAFTPVSSSGKIVTADPVVYVYGSKNWSMGWNQKRLSDFPGVRLFVPMKGSNPDLPHWETLMSLSWIRENNMKCVGLPGRAQKECKGADIIHLQKYVVDYAEKVMSSPTFKEDLEAYYYHRRIAGLSNIDDLMKLADTLADPLINELVEVIEPVRVRYVTMPLTVPDVHCLHALHKLELIKLPAEPKAKHRAEILHERVLSKRPVLAFTLGHVPVNFLLKPENASVLQQIAGVRTR